MATMNEIITNITTYLRGKVYMMLELAIREVPVKPT
jgi:hypothetical protein